MSIKHSKWWQSISPLVVCSLASFFYIYEFTVRVAPSAMSDDLMSSFGIQASGFSILAAMFFYGYTPLQIPAGLLYDRVGPRFLLSLSTLLCALATAAFALTTHIEFAYFCRLIMGVTAAFAFIGALIIASRWFPPRHFALFAGIVQFMGCIGAIVGLAPIAALTGHLGWRPATMMIAAVGVVFSILMWLIIRDYPAGYQLNLEKKHERPHNRLKAVCQNSQTWWVALYSLTCWAPIDIFATVWGTPYLMNLYHTNATKAAAGISLIWLGIAIGSPVAGWWSSHINRRRTPMIVCSCIGLVASIAVLYCGALPKPIMAVFLFLFGVSASSQVIGFGLVLDNNRDAVMGTAVGFNNMAVITGGALLQPLVGFILDIIWNHEYINGIPFYSIQEFQKAMSMVPVICILGIICSVWFIKETHCKRKHPTPS